MPLLRPYFLFAVATVMLLALDLLSSGEAHAFNGFGLLDLFVGC